jgi:hypothetical protein
MKLSAAAGTAGFVLAATFAQSQLPPAYVREGDRVEQVFREHRDRLTSFFQDLRTTIQREAPPSEAGALARQLQSAPPPTNVYGYQKLPQIVEIPQPPAPISSFTYSWPTTEGYVQGEITRLDRARSDLARVTVAPSDEKLALLTHLVAQYREMVRNQRTVDQYVQYNRFWQRSIAEDRARFDQLTVVYNTLKNGNLDVSESIRRILGRPQSPGFLRVRRAPNQVTLTMRLYTDIEDDAYLSRAEAVIEESWNTIEGNTRYTVETEFRKVSRQELYRGENVPKDGDHLDLEQHVAQFPRDGGVLTTGAQFTYGSVGRYVALGPGDLSPRTLAHEFGHILGFPDGYVRGYADLGDRGFEILELTAFFDDIMSAPREGRVQPTHFRLLLESLD